MQGIAFTEFLEMVETRCSPAMLEALNNGADLSSKGFHTAVGTYPPTLTRLRLKIYKSGE